MRKIILLVLLFLFSLPSVYAEYNFESDYTLIDCKNGDNSSGIAFDKTKPFSTLKVGIEKTISYINTKVNIAGNEETASGKIFHIKANCSFYDILNPTINLNYLGENFKNELIIEGIGDNSLIFKETSFQLSNNAGNITFKNAIFTNENKPYFYDFIFPSDIQKRSPFSNGIKIIDSYIKLKNSNNIGSLEVYELYDYKNPKKPFPDYLYPSNYVNKQIIENSTIDIEIGSDFNFRMPVSIKNSKINFTNSGAQLPYNVTFLEDGNSRTHSELNYSALISNEINLGGNNLSIEDTINIAFLNNKIMNINNFNFGGQGIFVNNYIENNQIIDITKFKNLYNNILKSGFTDSYDIFNYRKNYSANNIGKTGIGWVYKKLRDNKYFNLDINSAGLYKEITGKDLPMGLGYIYVIFNY